MHLFIDDERMPPADQNNWLIARTYDSAIDILQKFNIDYISFDHDLGDGGSGMDVAKWLVEYDIDNDIIGDKFDFFVHSQNPVGTENINKYLGQYIEEKINCKE